MDAPPTEPSRLRDKLTSRHLAVLISALGVLTVFLLAHEVFPYHTSNHDEAVYLQQAAMLLEGRLFIHPPVPHSMRPWFFVQEGGTMYPKYSPVPAAMFAVGKLLGGFRVALALVAGGVLALTYATIAEAFDRRTGVLASGFLFVSPLFLVDASVFLPYVPTTFWNLVFAFAYLRADRTGSRRYAALAGVAVGVAFFARPYTAVLFALPFIAHALWTLRGLDRETLTRQSVTATLGFVGVVVTLGYNAVVTGDPFVFPYAAFAPQDGLGFGHREILGYDRDYTPWLAVRANARVLVTYATDWVAAGLLGTLTAIAGLGWWVRHGDRSPRQSAVAGVALTVVLGNVYFWGTLNILGELADPTDGLVSFLGPYYHVDLLIPTALFAALGIQAAWRYAKRTLDGFDARHIRSGVLAAFVLTSLLAGALTAGALADPIQDNAAVTDQYEQAYAPFENHTFENAVVFLPTPYGDWLAHPFQALRNDPGFDGDAVYAIQERQFAVADAFPDRTLYRYSYRGEWLPYANQAVEPKLERIHVTEGERVETTIRAGVPETGETVSIRVSTANGSDYATVTDTRKLSLTLAVEDGTDDENATVTLTGDGFETPASVTVSGRDSVVMTMFVDYGTGAGFNYRIVVPVDDGEESVRLLTPYTEVCRNQRLCGGEATSLPGETRDGVYVRTNTTSAE
jgi:hypothetical protein